MLSVSNKAVIVDLIGLAIDKIRQTGVITSFVEVTPGIYNIQSINELVKNEAITINEIDYIVSNVSSSSFTISGISGLDFTGASWKAKAPYYMYGHPIEIVKILSEKDRSQTFKYQKYPLIMLVQDFRETVFTGGSEANLTFILANITKPNYVAEDRYTNNFKPILYPLEAKLKRTLKMSGLTQLLNPDSIEETDKLYWGKEGLYGNEGNIFNDCIDAIEMKNVNVRFKNNC